ncbi:MAG: hypothetical protein QF393_00630 [Rhodospirillales bacterium]|nr:hypothetical protein [Rhodospirillales bacterium]
MPAKLPMFNVIVNAAGVSIAKVPPASPNYAKASEGMILRDRDAILRFNELNARRKRLTGCFSFQHLDTARTFAMLCLEDRQQGMADNIDRVLAYDGSGPSSNG